MASSMKFRALLWLLLTQTLHAIEVDWNSPASVKSAARITADGMMSYYHGNESGQIPGLLPGPYYWWEAGAMFGALINYWHYTGDATYNPVVIQAMQFQVGPHNDYMPPNQSKSLGNDDQAFWAMAALQATEYNFPDPPDPKDPSWLSLAQAVFNEQVGRWDTTTCNGGIRWQIYPITGFDLKNTISNGCLFNIAARLARYTGDDMYAQWAIKLWDWMWRIGLINEQYGVYDNSEANRMNCTQLDRAQWTYNAGTILMGASAMYNYTNGDPVWKERTTRLLDNAALSYFQPKYNGAMTDICEEAGVCNYDQKSFKAYLARWMAAATQMAPFTYDTVAPLLLTSAKAAAAQCNGPPRGGTACGIRWYKSGTWDGTDGVGQQMTALEVIIGTMVNGASAPVTHATGGTSLSNPTAGFNGSAIPPGIPSKAKTGDRIGAWFLTVVLVLAVSALWAFMSSEVSEFSSGPMAPTVGGLRGRKSRVWKGSNGDLNSIMMSPATRGGTTLGYEDGNRASTVLRKKSALSMEVLPTGETRNHDRVQSISSGLGRGEIHPPGSPMMERFSGPDRTKTPVYKGGDLKT